MQDHSRFFSLFFFFIQRVFVVMTHHSCPKHEVVNIFVAQPFVVQIDLIILSLLNLYIYHTKIGVRVKNEDGNMVQVDKESKLIS